MNEEKVMPQRSDRFDHPVKIPSIKKRHTVTLGAVPSSDSSITSTNITIASTANNAPSSVASAATAMESEPMSVQEDDERLTLNDLHHPSTTNIMIEVTYPPLPTEPYDATITQPPLPAEPFDLVAASPKHARVRLTNNHDGYLTPSSDEDDFSPSGRYKVPAYMTAHLPNVNANKHLPGVLSPSHDVIAQSTPTDVSTYNDLFNFDEANVKLSDLLNIDVGK